MSTAPPPTDQAVLAVATARMDRALEACWKADAEVVAAALHLLALRAREAYPQADAVRLCWSDQGDFLDVDGLEGSGGTQIDWFDEDSLAWNLSGGVDSVWMPFVEADHEDPNRANFRLPIQPTLEHLHRAQRPTAEVTVTVCHGDDGATVVFVDTDFEPDGTTLRVNVNRRRRVRLRQRVGEPPDVWSR